MILIYLGEANVPDDANAAEDQADQNGENNQNDENNDNGAEGEAANQNGANGQGGQNNANAQGGGAQNQNGNNQNQQQIMGGIGAQMHQIYHESDQSEELAAAMKTFFKLRKDTLKELSFECSKREGRRRNSDVKFLEHIDYCQNLEKFNASHKFRFSLGKSEIKALSRLPKLKEVTLRESSREFDPFMFHPLPGQNNPQPRRESCLITFFNNASLEDIVKLNMGENFGLDLEAFNSFATRSCPNLEYLDLNHCRRLSLNDEVITYFAIIALTNFTMLCFSKVYYPVC